MHTIVPLVCFLIVASANAISPLFLSDMWEWQTFKLEYKKYYWNEMEESFRFEIFQQNRRFIDEHNQLYAAGEVSYELGLNEYADLLPHELAHFMFGNNGTLENDEAELITFITPAHVSLPQAADWRQKGAVTAVKSQGKCGACWAFSTTGALEGQHFRKTGKLVSLSEQNLVDCAGGKYGNSGCGGGFPKKAFKYIKANGGIDTEASYPYTAKNGKCHFNKRTIGATVRGFVSIPKGNEKKLLEATATVGPISIAIDASQKSFRFYKRGVYDDTHCSSTRLDHAVLIVGYGSEGGHDYWLVKNSWSTVWGESGYLKIARNKNRCGLANAASYPLV